MLSIGLTGGIGSGKSYVAKVFQALRVPVYYADQRAKEMYYNPEVKLKVIQVLGEKAYHEDGKINTVYISDKVFADPLLLHHINNIIHPAVAEDFEIWKSRQDSPYILKEAAILFESGSYQASDLNISVVASQNLRIQRVSKRDLLPENHVKLRMNRQWTEGKRVAKADFLIFNDDRFPILNQILSIHEDIIRRTNS